MGKKSGSMHEQSGAQSIEVGVDWSAEEPQAIAVTGFDFDALDSPEDHLRELLANGGSLNTWLEEQTRMREFRARLEGFKDAVAQMLESERPKLLAWAMAYACGMTLTMGKSGPEIAAMFGRRKQAFYQEVDRICQRLGTRLVRLNQRDEASRVKMKRRNFKW